MNALMHPRRSFALGSGARTPASLGSAVNGANNSTNGVGNDSMSAVSYAVHWPFPEFSEGTNYENMAEISEEVRRQRRSYSSSSSEASGVEEGTYEDADESDYEIVSRSENGSTPTSRRAESIAGSDMSALYAFRKAQKHHARSLKAKNVCAKVAVHPLSSDWNLESKPRRSFRDHLRNEISKTAIKEERQLNSNIQASHLRASSRVRSVLKEEISTAFSQSSSPTTTTTIISSGNLSSHHRRADLTRPRSAVAGQLSRTSSIGRSDCAGSFDDGGGMLGASGSSTTTGGGAAHSAAGGPLSIDDLTLLIRLFESDAGLKHGGHPPLSLKRSPHAAGGGGGGERASAGTSGGAVQLKHMSLDWLGKRHGFTKQVIPPLVNLHLGNFASHVAKCDGDIPPDRVLINSPRSAVVLLRNGIAVEELIPRPAVVKKARVLAARQALESQTQRPTSTTSSGLGSVAATPTSKSRGDVTQRPSSAAAAAARKRSASSSSTGLRPSSALLASPAAATPLRFPSRSSQSASSTLADGTLNRVIGSNANDLVLSKAEEELERLRLHRLAKLVSEYVNLCEAVSLNDIIDFCSKYDKNRPSSALRVECALTREKKTLQMTDSATAKEEEGRSFSSSFTASASRAIGGGGGGIVGGGGRRTMSTTRSVAGAKIGDLLPEEAAEERFQRIFDRNAAFERTIVNCQQKVIADDEAKRAAAQQRLLREQQRSAKLVEMREAKLAQMREEREAREAVKRIQRISVDRARSYRSSALREPIIRRDDEVENIAKARQRAILRYKNIIVHDIHKDEVKKQNVSAARANAKQPKVTWTDSLSS